MSDIFIPTLHTFAMNNVFTGSSGMLRFRIKPNVQMLTPKEVDFENSSITAQYWHSILAYHPDRVEGEETFPMSEEGRLAMKAWLEAQV